MRCVNSISKRNEPGRNFLNFTKCYFFQRSQIFASYNANKNLKRYQKLAWIAGVFASASC